MFVPFFKIKIKKKEMSAYILWTYKQIEVAYLVAQFLVLTPEVALAPPLLLSPE